MSLKSALIGFQFCGKASLISQNFYRYFFMPYTEFSYCTEEVTINAESSRSISSWWMRSGKSQHKSFKIERFYLRKSYPFAYIHKQIHSVHSEYTLVRHVLYVHRITVKYLIECWFHTQFVSIGIVLHCCVVYINKNKS